MKFTNAQYDIVEVVWDDAETGDGWESLEHMGEPTEKLATTIGFLVKETPKHLIVCHTRDDKTNTNGRMQIPKGMIKKRRVIQKKNPAL